MADKGIMIELRIDPTRITALPPLCAQTVISSADEEAIIVVPEASELAETTQQELARVIGATLPLVPSASLFSPEQIPANAIALGHAGNNGLLRALHDRGFLDERLYPTEGYRVLSVHNPFGDGHNVLCVLGLTEAGLRAGLAALLTTVVQRDGCWLIEQAVYLVEPRPETPDPETLLAMLKDLYPGMTGHPQGAFQALDHLRLTGEERWARAFITLLEPYASGHIPLSFWLMSAVDFWTDRLILGWDAVEELPFFSDGERLMVVNFIVACTQYCHDSITYQKWRILPQDHMIFNHHTFPATGLFFGCQYLRRHGYELPDLQDWLTKSLKVFARAATVGRSFDEGGAGYSWLVGNHLLRVSAATGDYSYARSEKMMAYADLAAVIQNNAFELVPFGDCHGYHATGTEAAGILLSAADWHRDGGCKWLAEKHAPALVAKNVFTRDLPALPPEKYVGLFVLPLDPVIWRWTSLPMFPGYPPPAYLPSVPAQQSFDKLSLRGGWEPTDDYLLLQGFGAGQHGHPDANAISQYQAQGRLFLVDMDYIKRMPREHNMVMVIRDGEHGPIPPIARLDSTVDFAGGAFTQSTLVDYNGCDWTRSLLWLRNDCVIAVDSLKAKVAGDYELRCYWRTLGEAELTERGMHADHTGEHFHVIEATDSERRLDFEPVQLSTTEHPKYSFGDGQAKVLCETQRVHLEAGEEACFVNLLLPNRQEATPRRSLRFADDGRLLLSGGSNATLEVNGFQVGALGSYAFSDKERLTALSGCAARAGAAPTAPVAPAAPARQRTWETPLPAPATCLAPLPDGAALVGCEDGTIARVTSDGELQPLGKAADRVGAVLAGRLFGEADLTCMAACYDYTLRWFSEDGGERRSIELPKNSHMPAWGTALATADLDGDGKQWPIVGTAAWRVHAVRPDGAFRWTFDTAAHDVTWLATGDLNGDGREEVAVATVYYNILAIASDGGRLWQDEDYNGYWNAGPNFPFVLVADVDGDGALEVITAGSDTLVHCIDHLGEKKWTRSVGDEAGGLLVTPAGLVAASRTGDVHLLDGRGERLWRTSLGQPCIALAATAQGLCVALEDGGLAWLDEAGKVTGQHQLAAPAPVLLGLGDQVLAASGGGLLRF